MSNAMSKPVLRFAPSPNGLLHLGHAYSALYTSFWAERMGGRLLLRIEDTDIVRSKPEFTDAIFEDLAWLGLSWEEPVWRQSERFDVYAAHAERLRARGLLYPVLLLAQRHRRGRRGHRPGWRPDLSRHLPASRPGPRGGEARRRRGRATGG